MLNFLTVLSVQIFQSSRQFCRKAEVSVHMRVIQFPDPHPQAPRRPDGFSVHTMLISLFRDGTPQMAFVMHLYAKYGIVSVRHWDDAGGNLFGDFPLDAEARQAFITRIGVPERPRRANVAEVVALFPPQGKVLSVHP
jgi:hypothetical protein